MKRLLMFSTMMAILVGGVAQSASADVYNWTTWTAATPGSPTGGTATGTAGGVGISYTGEVQSLVNNYPSWLPASSYIGGNVGNAPPQSGGEIQLFGGNSVTDTITFSSAVTNPVIAIWSLGQGGIDASFDFSAPATIVAGGPSNEYSGSSIFPCSGGGNNVCGIEGNGVVEFNGTFSSISWTNPTFENWYGFTVGVAATPEPGFYGLMALGMGGLAFFVHRKKALNS